MNRIRFYPVYVGVYLVSIIPVLAYGSLRESILTQLALFLFWCLTYGFTLIIGFRHAVTPKTLNEQIMTGFAGIGLIVFLYSLALDSLINALVALLLWLLAAKHCTLALRRDLFYAYMITFIIMLFGAANSKSSMYLLYMVAYVLAVTFALIANYIDARLNLAEHQGSSVDRYHVPMKYSVAGLAVIVLTLASLLYLFTPRPPALNIGAFFSDGGPNYHDKNWDKAAGDGKNLADQEQFAEKSRSDDVQQPQDDPATDPANNSAADIADGDTFRYGGFEQYYDMSAIGSGSLSNALVLYLQADRPLYLRGMVFDVFENDSWRRSETRDRKHRIPRGGLELGQQHKPQIQQLISLQQNIKGEVFAASKLEKLEFPGTVVARDHYGNIFVPGILRKGTVYSALSYIEEVHGHPATGPVTPPAADQYRQLPEQLHPALSRLARDIGQHDSDELQQALSVENYLRTNFTYSLDTVYEKFSLAAINRFLFDTRRGHCELFATSMVLMLRSLGMQARLATGFSATNMNPITGYFEVRGLDAHAWVEAYFSNFGWVSFEPTAFYALPQREQPASTAGALTEYLNNLQRGSQLVETGSWNEVTLTTLVATLKAIAEYAAMLWHTVKQFCITLFMSIKAMGVYLATLGLVATLLYIAFLRWRHPVLSRLAVLRLARQVKGDPGHFIVECFEEMEKFFTRLGKPRSPATTIGDYSTALVADFGARQDAINYISRCTHLALYGGKAPTTEQVREALSCFQRLAETRDKRQ